MGIHTILQSSSPPNFDQALLQFVALALPAVAIMMDVLISFRDEYEIDRSVLTEYIFLLVSFLLLVVGAFAFGYSIFRTTPNPATRFGIMFVLAGLLALLVGIWLTIGRVVVPDRYFERGRDVIKYSAAVAIPLIIIVSILVLFRQRISGEIQVNQQVFVLASIMILVLVATAQTYINYSRYVKTRERAREWSNRVSDILDEMKNLRPLEGKILEGELPRSMENRQQDLEELITRPPSRIPERTIDKLNDISTLYGDVIELIDSLSTTRRKISNLEDRLESFKKEHQGLVEERAPIEVDLQNLEDSKPLSKEERRRYEEMVQEREELISETESIKNRIEAIHRDLDELYAEEDEITEMLDSMVEELDELIESVNLSQNPRATRFLSELL